MVGADYDATLTYLERAYNDGTRYVLDYVTAREAYNLARAAADGATGDPPTYMDAYAPRYVANTGPGRDGGAAALETARHSRWSRVRASTDK